MKLIVTLRPAGEYAGYVLRLAVAGGLPASVIWKFSAEGVASGELALPVTDMPVWLSAQVLDRGGAPVREARAEAAKVEGGWLIDLGASPAAPSPSPSPSPSPAQVAVLPRKLRGKAADLHARITPRNAQVVLFARRAKDAPPAPIVVTTTDGQGCFSVDYPRGAFTAVEAVVSTSPTERIAVALDESGGLPAFVYLVMERLDRYATQGDHDACACNAPTPRLPDHDDLVSLDHYTQDIGASCVNFTTPNRALEEFSYSLVVRTTDPEIRGVTTVDVKRRVAEIDAEMQSILRDAAELLVMPAGGTGKKEVAKGPGAPPPDTWFGRRYAALQRERDLLLRRDPGRAFLGAFNSIDWDDAPTTYQAVTLAHGHVLSFRQVWRADGYSMGDLVYSLPLAPGQKKQVVIYDWERRETASRTEEQRLSESLQSTVARDRAVSEVVNSVLHESMSGGSHSSVDSSSGGFGGAIAGFAGDVLFAVAGGFSASQSSSDSSSWQDASRTLAATNEQRLRDVTMQSASAVRSQRATVVQSVAQGETMTVETESLANYNHCHAITIQYFEVLRHFAISHELVDVQECLFVPLPIGPFDDAKVVRWRDLLSRALLDRRLAGGFDAVDRYHRKNVLRDADAYASMPAARFCDETITFVHFRLELACRVSRPPELYPPDAPPPTTGGMLNEVIELQRQRALLDNPADEASWGALLGFVPGWPEIRRRVLHARRDQRDAAFQTEMRTVDWVKHYLRELNVCFTLPGGVTLPFSTAPAIVARSGPPRNPVEASRAEERVTVAFMHEGAAMLRREVMASVDVWHPRRPQPDVLPEGSYVKPLGGRMDYRTPHFTGSVFRDFVSYADLARGDKLIIATPMSADELRNPIKEDLELRQRLLAHLDRNLEHYHKVLFSRMSPDRRYMLLDGFQVNVPGRRDPRTGQRLPDERRSLASVIENRVIGVAGNCLVMPVARGYNLDPVFRFDDDVVTRPDGTTVSRLFHQYAPETGLKPPPFRVSVPTRGVFSEAVMGACNSCEKKDDTRFWRWEESPIPDSPTAIAPVSTDSRRADPGDLQAKDLPPPMVQIQNAPAAPDPTGLAAAFNLLGKGDAFRDMAGLAGTQGLTMEGLKTTSAAALSYAGLAADLVKTASANKNAQSIEDGIQRSSLPPEKKQELLEDLYRARIGGGGKAGDESERGGGSPGGDVMASGEIRDALREAAASAGGSIRVKSPDGSQVDIQNGGPQRQPEEDAPTLMSPDATGTFYVVHNEAATKPGVRRQGTALEEAAAESNLTVEKYMEEALKEANSIWRDVNGVKWIRFVQVEKRTDVPASAAESPLDGVLELYDKAATSGNSVMFRLSSVALHDSSAQYDLARGPLYLTPKELGYVIAHETLHQWLSRMGYLLFNDALFFTPESGSGSFQIGHLDRLVRGGPLVPNLNMGGDHIGDPTVRAIPGWQRLLKTIWRTQRYYVSRAPAFFSITDRALLDYLEGSSLWDRTERYATFGMRVDVITEDCVIGSEHLQGTQRMSATPRMESDKFDIETFR